MNWTYIILIVHASHAGDCRQQQLAYAQRGLETIIITDSLNLRLRRIETFDNYVLYTQDTSFYSVETQKKDMHFVLVINHMIYTGLLNRKGRPFYGHYRRHQFKSLDSWHFNSHRCR